MEYFWLRTDRSLEHGIHFHPLSKEELAGREPIIRQTQISEGRKETIFPDYLTTNTIRGQYHLVSDRMKQLCSLFLTSITDYMPFVLVDQLNESYLYWFLLPRIVENGISEKTTYNFDQTVKDLVLLKEYVPKESIFSVETNLQRIIVLKLDAAESMLRRGFYGMKLSRIVLEESNGTNSR